MIIFSRKTCNLIAAIGCYSLIAIAYFYFEKTQYLTPCPLCYAQRIAFAIIGFFFLVAFALPNNSISSRINGIWIFILSIAGAALSIRHLYLQNLPKNELSATCGQDFYALLENAPVPDILFKMLTGTGDCGEIQWTFLGISMPGWTLIAFIICAIWAITHNLLRK